MLALLFFARKMSQQTQMRNTQTLALLMPLQANSQQ